MITINGPLPPGNYTAKSFTDLINGNDGIEHNVPVFMSKEQIAVVVNWLRTWEQIRDGAIPIRFIEDFKGKSLGEIQSGIDFSNNFQKKLK